PSQTVPLPAAQVTAAGVGVPTQFPATQVSFSVHAEESSHVPEWGCWRQPVAGTQLSSVHSLLSLQFGGGVASHWPFVGLQVFTPSQRSASAQTTGAPFWQPVAALQVSTPLQGLLSSQVSAT